MGNGYRLCVISYHLNLSTSQRLFISSSRAK